MQSYAVVNSGTQLQFSTQTFSQIGTYTFSLTGTITNYSSRSAVTYFTVYVTDPCLSTVISATPLSAMSTSVLVQLANGTPFYATQTVVGVSDTLSVSQGSQVCGSYKYTVSSVPNSPAVALTAFELFFDSTTTSLLKVYTALSSKVGTHTVTVSLGFVNIFYAAATTTLAEFILTINPCIVTAVKVV